eukprot:COSAG05_NODE_1612_length_4407_cov_43.627205_1_plen_82_part_10
MPPSEPMQRPSYARRFGCTAGEVRAFQQAGAKHRYRLMQRRERLLQETSVEAEAWASQRATQPLSQANALSTMLRDPNTGTQ